MTNQTESKKKGWLRIRKDRSRQQLWPIKLKWIPLKHYSCCGGFVWLTRHWWHAGAEYVAAGSESENCIPGIRDVFGWTFHFGPIKVVFGKNLEPPEDLLQWAYDRQKHLADNGHAPSVPIAKSLGDEITRREMANAGPVNAPGGAA